MKRAIVLLLFLLCFGFAFADTITGYVVPSSVALGNNVTATGLFADTNGNKANYLCSFYFLDANTGNLIKRATDQYTTTTGRVTMAGFQIVEPLFKRGQTYTLRTECGLTSADKNFLVAQRETIADAGAQEFEFVTNQGNTDTIFIWGLMGALILLVIGTLAMVFKWGAK